MECENCLKIIFQNNQLLSNYKLHINCYFRLYKNTCPLCNRPTIIYSLNNIKNLSINHKLDINISGLQNYKIINNYF